MVRLISRQRGGVAALKLTKLFGIDDFRAAKDSGKVLIIIIYCYLIIIITMISFYSALYGFRLSGWLLWPDLPPYSFLLARNLIFRK